MMKAYPMAKQAFNDLCRILEGGAVTNLPRAPLVEREQQYCGQHHIEMVPKPWVLVFTT